MNNDVSPASAPQVIAVVGPTAAGKSDLGVTLARQLGGEVVNADSMQLYRGMDIGTAKLTAAERGGRPAPPARHLGRHRGGERRRVPAAGPGRDRPPARPPAVPRSWSAARGCTCGPPSTRWSSRAPTRRCAPAWRRNSNCTARGALHARLAAVDPQAARAILPEQRPPHRARPGGRGDHRPALHRQPPRPRRRSTTPCRSGSTSRGRSSTSGSPCASTGCGRPDSSARCARWRRPGCAKGCTASRALGYQQVLAALRRGVHARRRRVPRRYGPPSASRADRTRGSAATRGCTGCPPAGRELTDRALALLERAVTA